MISVPDPQPTNLHKIRILSKTKLSNLYTHTRREKVRWYKIIFTKK